VRERIGLATGLAFQGPGLGKDHSASSDVARLQLGQGTPCASSLKPLPSVRVSNRVPRVRISGVSCGNRLRSADRGAWPGSAGQACGLGADFHGRNVKVLNDRRRIGDSTRSDLAFLILRELCPIRGWKSNACLSCRAGPSMAQNKISRSCQRAGDSLRQQPWSQLPREPSPPVGVPRPRPIPCRT
jgi:hypothetical protein